MIVGLWEHLLNTPKADGIDYGPEASIDMKGYTVRWLDHFLKDIDNGVEEDASVHVFVMGENKWHAEEDWSLPQARPTKYDLVSNGHTNSLKSDGGLTTSLPDGAEFEAYVYDPRNPTRDTSDGKASANCDARDTRLTAIGDEVLVYRTPPLTSPVDVTGPIEAPPLRRDLRRGYGLDSSARGCAPRRTLIVPGRRRHAGAQQRSRERGPLQWCSTEHDRAGKGLSIYDSILAQHCKSVPTWASDRY